MPEDKKSSKSSLMRTIRGRKARKITLTVIFAALIISLVTSGINNNRNEKSTGEAGELLKKTEKSQNAEINLPSQQEKDQQESADVPEGKTDVSGEKAETSEEKAETSEKENQITTKEVQDKVSNKDKQPPKTEESKKDETKEPPKDTRISVKIEIDCTSVSQDMSILEDKSVLDFIPKDGHILPKTSYEVDNGTTAFDFLQSTCRNKNIQLDYSYTPAFGTNYVKGIGYLYEKMAGSRSGWIYLVNGLSPNYGSDSYRLQDGDLIKWMYVCE